MAKDSSNSGMARSDSGVFVKGGSSGGSPLLISRNKHLPYIASYHGPWLSLPLELLQSIFALNVAPPSPALDVYRKAHSSSSASSLLAPQSPLPPPIDSVVFRNLLAIRRLVDEAAELVIKALGGGLAAPTASNPLGMQGSQPRSGRISSQRQLRLRELAVSRLASAYRIDEIATSVLTMQSASALDDVAAKVLLRQPRNADALYVHFFHEKIPSRQLHSTSTQDLDDLCAMFPCNPEYFRTRGLIRCYRGEYDRASKDFKEAIRLVKKRRENNRMHNGFIEGFLTFKDNDSDDDPVGLLQRNGEAQLYFLRAATAHQHALSLVEDCVHKFYQLRNGDNTTAATAATAAKKKKKKKSKKASGASVVAVGKVTLEVPFLEGTPSEAALDNVSKESTLDDTSKEAALEETPDETAPEETPESSEDAPNETATQDASTAPPLFIVPQHILDARKAIEPDLKQIFALVKRSNTDYIKFLDFFSTKPPFSLPDTFRGKEKKKETSSSGRPSPVENTSETEPTEGQVQSLFQLIDLAAMDFMEDAETNDHGEPSGGYCPGHGGFSHNSRHDAISGNSSPSSSTMSYSEASSMMSPNARNHPKPTEFLNPSEDIHTYHPLLLDTFYTLTLNYLLTSQFDVAYKLHIWILDILKILDGYPVFLPARSMAQADYAEVVRVLWNADKDSQDRNRERNIMTAAFVKNRTLANGTEMTAASPVLNHKSASSNDLTSGSAPWLKPDIMSCSFKQYPLHTKRAETMVIWLKKVMEPLDGEWQDLLAKV